MDLILVYAIPGFVALLALEWLVVRAGDGDRLGFEGRDTRTSILMGLGSLVTGAVWKLGEIAVLVLAARLSPLDLGTGWVAWTIALVGVDVCYYWDHRACRQIRLLWAAHVVHHSSQRYNLSTALRQSWVSQLSALFFIPVALLGVPAKIILAAYAINLLYQFWIHTEAIDRMWAPVEWVFNTPSHHRVHHGSQAQYLDRNYGGILIVWDRLFGSFEPEGERVVYGLTSNITTYNPLRVATHGYLSLARDVRSASGWRDRAGYLLRGPGWSPALTGSPAPAVAVPA